MALKISLVVIILGIAYLSLTPIDIISIGNDKVSHFIAYGVLMTNVGLLFYEQKTRFIFGIVLCLMYGALIEVGQHFVPGRFMSGMDMLANAGGVAMGIIISWLFYPTLIKILKKTRII